MKKIKLFIENIKENFLKLNNNFINFIKTIKYKLSNLYETNYNTGLKFIEDGNLFDAVFRFKLIKIFFPKKVEPKYQYAYCLALYKYYPDAKFELQKIINEFPDYEDAKILLNQIETKEFNKIVEEYNKKRKK